ncbi:MAG: inner membrane-spanning protein YciB [Caulobacteraceae bacterium]
MTTPDVTTPPAPAPWVRMVVDYCGPAAFMLGFFLTHDMLKASGALVVGSLIGVAIGFAKEKRVAPLPLIWAGTAIIFGTLTLVFHDVRIVKMKTTLIDAALGLAMLGGLAIGKSPIKVLMGDTLTLSEASWRKLTLRFGLFFLAMAVANEIIWRTQPDAIWVMFRFPGLLVLSLLFSATQIPVMMKDGKLTGAAVSIAETQE